MKLLRLFKIAVVIFGVSCISITSAVGQSFPTKSIRVIVPFAAGGSTDAMARIVGQQMSANLGQAVVAENRPGASGNIAAEFAAKSPPDGYTMVVVPSNLYCVNPFLMPNRSIDPFKDLTEVSLAVKMPLILVVNPSVAVHTVNDFINLARANPGGISYASSGTGTTPHIAGEQFKLAARVNLVHIPYKGGAPALVDVIGGQVPAMFAVLPDVIQHVRSGKVRGIAVTSDTRSPMAPEIPTIAESGLPEFRNYTWYGYAVASATPTPIVAKLSAEIARAVSAGETLRRLSDMGFDVVGSSPEEFNTWIRSDCARVAKIIKEANIKGE